MKKRRTMNRFKIRKKNKYLWLGIFLVMALFLGCKESDIDTGASGLSWPIGCTPEVDCTITNYVDLDSSGGKKVWDGSTHYYDGTPKTYDGHNGTDIIPGSTMAESWTKMDEGMAVLAAADGIVLATYDSLYDRCAKFPPDGTTQNGGFHSECTPGGMDSTSDNGYTGTGNWIYLEHTGVSGVSKTIYFHLKTDSVIVTAGDSVVRGQKLAEVGSSGQSSNPHLHFGVLNGSGLVDPYWGVNSASATANANPLGKSLWVADPEWTGVSLD
jgi:murein DD-endopeptidase MepM/ murein hydrolase activator NlpD